MISYGWLRTWCLEAAVFPAWTVTDSLPAGSPVVGLHYNRSAYAAEYSKMGVA
jgi:hypothetical protein